MTIKQGPCPECGAFWPTEIIACTECGYDPDCPCCYLREPKTKEVICFSSFVW